jgi:hypothetical protein
MAARSAQYYAVRQNRRSARQSNGETRTVVPLVRHPFLLPRGRDFLGPELEALCLYRAWGAHHHVEQDDPVFFAGDAIRLISYGLVAMFANR